jgi:hypothetical protein
MGNCTAPLAAIWISRGRVDRSACSSGLRDYRAPENSAGNAAGTVGRTEGEQYSPLTRSSSTGQRPRRLSALFTAINSSWNRQFEYPPLQRGVRSNRRFSVTAQALPLELRNYLWPRVASENKHRSKTIGDKRIPRQIRTGGSESRGFAASHISHFCH